MRIIPPTRRIQTLSSYDYSYGSPDQEGHRYSTHGVNEKLFLKTIILSKSFSVHSKSVTHLKWTEKTPSVLLTSFILLEMRRENQRVLMQDMLANYAAGQHFRVMGRQGSDIPPVLVKICFPCG